jgi:hypothetical protein
MAYGRVGRKRKLGEREQNGRILREKPEAAELIAKLQPHRLCLPEHLRLDPKAENHMGRLNLIGALSDDQYEAGRRFLQVVSNYRVVIGSPSGASFSAGMVMGRGELCEDECVARKVAYEWAFEALAKTEMPPGKTSPGISNLAQRAVSAVAVHDTECPTSIDYLRAGLDALARHFGVKSNVVKFEIRATPIFEEQRVLEY